MNRFCCNNWLSCTVFHSDVVRSFDGTVEQRLVVSTSPILMSTCKIQFNIIKSSKTRKSENSIVTVHLLLSLVARRRRSPSENRKFVVVPSSPVLQKSSEIRLCSSPPENTLIYLEPTVHLLSSMTHSHQNNREANLPQNDPVISQTDPATTNHPFVRHEIQTLDRREEYDEDYLVPFTIDAVSCFRPTMYQSPLLPPENKPLETKMLKKVKDVLFEVDIKTMAMYITKIDCMVGLAL